MLVATIWDMRLAHKFFLFIELYANQSLQSRFKLGFYIWPKKVVLMLKTLKCREEIGEQKEKEDQKNGNTENSNGLTSPHSQLAETCSNISVARGRLELRNIMEASWSCWTSCESFIIISKVVEVPLSSWTDHWSSLSSRTSWGIFIIISTKSSKLHYHLR